MIMLLLMLMSWAAATHACSNFLLEGGGDFVVSARTMDLGPGLSFGVATVPAGSKLSGGGTEPTRESKALLGFVGFVPVEAGLVLEHFVTAGMNTAGLSCDQQTLLGSVYPNKTGNATTDVAIDHFCERVLARFNGTAQLAAALAERRLTPHGPSVAGGQHFVVRDARGESLVVEFTDGTASVFVDHNDGGESGFGILTNEPNFQWHVENVRHARWKMRNARPSFTLPGAYYPDERFLRIDLLKRGMPKPTAMREAIQQAVHVLNSVTVPAGAQMGTRFLATAESDFAPVWKEGIVQAGDRGSLIARGLVGPARWIKSPVSLKHQEKTLDMTPGVFLGKPDDPNSDVSKELIRQENEHINAAYLGEADNSLLGGGECAQRIDDMPPVQEVVDETVKEATEIIEGLAARHIGS